MLVILTENTTSVRWVKIAGMFVYNGGWTETCEDIVVPIVFVALEPYILVNCEGFKVYRVAHERI